jgi:phosphomevalonate kinase
VSVAVVAAMRAAAGLPGDHRDDIFAAALGAHRAAQDSVGSGGDVAASVYGGLILFEPRGEALPRVTPLPPPPGLELLVAWSGTAAATAPLVRRYLALGRTQRSRFVRLAEESVRAFAGALASGRLCVESVSRNGRDLESLAAEAGLPLVTPALAHIVELARAAGAGAKVSGAGGGDCAIALATEPGVVTAVRRAWREAGLTELDLHLATGGVHVAQA